MAKRFLLYCIFMILLSGCATLTAPSYNTNFDNVRLLRNENLKSVRIGAFTISPSIASGGEKLLLRAVNYSPPAGNFATYLQNAIKEELKDARLFDLTSSIEISSVLLENSIDISSFSVGKAEIKAQFTVRDAGVLKYDKKMSATHSWESAFAGYIAIPSAQSNYPAVVRKLITMLFSDPDFLSVLR